MRSTMMETTPARFGLRMHCPDPAYRSILRARFSDTGVLTPQNVAIGRFSEAEPAYPGGATPKAPSLTAGDVGDLPVDIMSIAAGASTADILRTATTYRPSLPMTSANPPNSMSTTLTPPIAAALRAAADSSLTSAAETFCETP